MGAFSGACILAMGVGYLEPRLGDQAALVGALAGLVCALWLILRREGQSGSSAVVGLTFLAVILVVCLGYVAFS
jgi:hypothetical protein